MCAILSWAGRAKRGQWPEVHQLLTELLIASQCRGTDATGFAALNRQRRLIVDKGASRSSRFTATSARWNRLSSPSCLVAHTRAATHGSPLAPDGRNNHPFVGDDLAVVVNGVNPNYREVAADHAVTLTTECDSEIVLRLIENADTAVEGIQTCLDVLDGGIATAVLDAKHDRVLLTRNTGRPIWMLRLAHIDGSICCSTREIAEHALRHTYGKTFASLVHTLMPLASDAVFVSTPDGRVQTARSERRSIRRGLWLA